MEIANELIPHVLKSEDSRVQNDPQCFANVLRFYDGICSWEEGSATPIMHIGWAKPMVSTCSKFEAKIRRLVEPLEPSGNLDAEGAEGEIFNNNYYEKYEGKQPTHCDQTSEKIPKSSLRQNNCAKEEQLIGLLSELCHSRVLNIDYLLGQSDRPFLNCQRAKNCRKRPNSSLSSSERSTPPPSTSTSSTAVSSPKSSTSTADSPSTTTRIHLKLKSAKMIGLKDLLLAEKLSTNAIQLQLTAQSQVSTANHSVNYSAFDESTSSGRPKRARREL